MYRFVDCFVSSHNISNVVIIFFFLRFSKSPLFHWQILFYKIEHVKRVLFPLLFWFEMILHAHSIALTVFVNPFVENQNVEHLFESKMRLKKVKKIRNKTYKFTDSTKHFEWKCLNM